MTVASLVDVLFPRTRHGRSLLLVIPLLLALVVPAGAQSVIDPDLDSDGDGIVNAFDPDDDNDGITDDSDPAPFDSSNPGSAPPPSSIDPDADSDGDGVANSHDPDDDNDGWVDRSDPVVFDSDNTLPESGDGSSGNPGGSTGGNAPGGASNGSAPVSGAGGSGRSTTTGGSSSPQGGVRISGLPNTGSGGGTDAPHGPGLWMIPATLCLIFFALALHLAPAVRPLTVRRQRTPLMRR